MHEKDDGKCAVINIKERMILVHKYLGTYSGNSGDEKLVEIVSGRGKRWKRFFFSIFSLTNSPTFSFMVY